MNIDISKDLNIKIIVNSTDTKTINNIYNTGNPAGTYLPGKDFSSTDNVSAGVLTTYQIGISLSSKSNQIYPIDKLFLQSFDDPQTNGTGTIPFYLLNNDPNPENTTDNDLYTVLPGYKANMNSVVFGPSSGITSSSTVSLSLNINYETGVYWKTKIAPKINAIAVKNNIESKSNLVLPTEVKMSSIANLTSNLYYQPHNDIAFTTQNNEKGFLVPFYLDTNLSNKIDLSKLLDEADFNTVTYQTNVEFKIDGTSIPILNSQLLINILSSSNVSIQSFNINNDILTIIIKKNGKIIYPFTIQVKAFLPYDPGNKDNVTVIANNSWYNEGVNWQNFTNQYIFNVSKIGGFTFSKVVLLKFVNPPKLQNNVSGYIQNNFDSVNSALTYTNLNFIRTLNSKLLLLYDSQISWLNKAAPLVNIVYTDILGVNVTFIPNASDYTQQYGYTPLINGYDPNIIAQNAMNGVINLGLYNQILVSGNKPNILMTTFKKELFNNLAIDYTKAVIIKYQDSHLERITNTDFLSLYNNNPTKNYTGYLYTVMRMSTNFADVLDANEAYGSLLGTGDKFETINNQVLLYLATNIFTLPTSIYRFNGISTVRFAVNVPTYKSAFQTSITNDNINTITQIFDYTATYPLRFYGPPTVVESSIIGEFKANTIMTFTIPPLMIPYLYIYKNPSIYQSVSNNPPILIATITEYSLMPGKISITIPQNFIFEVYGKTYIEIPIRFLTPANDIVFNHNTTDFAPKNLILAYPNEIITGFPSGSAYYKVNKFYLSSTLIGGGVDFTGLSVNKNLYPSASEVTYITSVKNLNIDNNSIYISATVPTNKYNPMNTSNNNLQAFITKITPFNSDSVIYYQTDNNATIADIAAMKYINVNGTNLSKYYNNVIVNTWNIYISGDNLPNNVVMMVSFTPNILSNTIIRIDYDVLVMMDANTTNNYINDSAINYFSTASNLESQSNKVSIENFNPSENIIVIKKPDTQNIIAELNETASFKIEFKIPIAAIDYVSLTFKDILPKSLSLLNDSTYQINGSNPILLNASFIDNVITKDFTDLSLLAGNIITVNLNVVLNNLLFIPISSSDINKASLIVNENFNYESNSVIINYIFENLFNPSKKPLLQERKKIIGEQIIFDLVFEIPQNITNLTDLVIKDTLSPALLFDEANSFLMIGTTNLGIIPAIVVNNSVIINFTPYLNLASGKTVKITLATILNSTLFDIIINNFTLTFNNTPLYLFTSNDVLVNLVNQINIIPIIKRPINQMINKLLNEIVNFVIEFTLPNYLKDYDTITITDILNEHLTYNNASTIKFGNNPIEPLNANINNKEITKILTNFSSFTGDKIVINLVTNLISIPNDYITNKVSLMINNDLTLLTNSNIVYIYFNSHYRCQAGNDIIESIALEQTALSHILNAEGEKLQKIFTIFKDINELILINNSIVSMIKSITLLETVLQGKLDLTKNCKYL